MSRSMPAHLAPIEDARIEQAAAAARTARRNQPKGLLLLASVLLVGAIIYLTMGFLAQREAAGELRDAREQAQETVAYAARLRALKAAAASAPQANASVSFLRTRIEQAGMEAGLTEAVRLPRETPENVQQSLGSRKRNFEYTISDPSMGALLSWMQRAVAAVPGLEISSVSITPEANKWRVRVIFSRWEKWEGA
ncbi:MAG TPA: hypothetical protein VD997_16720 [Phycisphaerales bacterium]|nr:hypothetical protein [Phycisphaerales bacterium]